MIFVVIINKFIGATAIIKTIPSTSTHVRNLYDMLIIYIRERDNNKLINVVVLLCACIYNLQICGSGTLFIQPLFIATFIGVLLIAQKPQNEVILIVII